MSRRGAGGRILVVTSGLAGMLYSSVELARRLAADGHRVTYSTRPHGRAVVEAQGLDFVPLEPDRRSELLDADARRGAPRRWLRLAERRRRFAEATGVGRFVRTLEEVKPDLLLIDGEMHEQIVAARGHGVPIALLNAFAAIWRRPGLPPPHRLVRPGVGWKGSRPGIRLLWALLRGRKRWRAASQWVRGAGCDRLSVLRWLARRAGVDLGRETDAGQWPIPFTWRRLPVLSLRPRELELPHRPPGHVRWVGPMVLEDRGTPPLPEAERAELDAVVERRRAGGGRRLIYAAFGSRLSTDFGLLRRLGRAVGGRSGEERPDGERRELVIALAAGAAPCDLGPLPDGVHAFGWLPQPELLRHADAAVIHGGSQTVDECVVHGVPMLVYCGFETDMAGNAVRVEHHGVGIVGDRRRDGVPEIRRRLDRLLGDPGYAERAGRLRRRCAAYAEERVAERAVSALLAAPGAPPPAQGPGDGAEDR